MVFASLHTPQQKKENKENKEEWRGQVKVEGG